MERSSPPADLSPFRALPRRRAFEEVILEIEQAIVDGRLSPGDRLPGERDLAQMLQVSRPALREALRVLEGFGVITARRGRGEDSGLIVTAGQDSGLGEILRMHSALLKVPLSDLVDIRLAIEAMTARSAAARRDGEALAELVTDMKGETDRDAYLALDTDFHVALARASGNGLAPLLMQALRESIAREMRLGFEEVEDWDSARRRLTREHGVIARHVTAGDAQAAESAVTSHIRGFYRVLQRVGSS